MHVLITGANRGIGAMLASKAQMLGHKVIGTARNLGPLDDSIDWLQLDVTAPESL